jgi:PAS domain S-box-containing protein
MCKCATGTLNVKNQTISLDNKKLNKKLNKKQYSVYRKQVIQLLALIVVFIGIIVLFGWATQSSKLIQVLPTFVPMQFNTALGFFLAGISLFISIRGDKKIASILGVFVASIGLLTIIQYVWSVDIGIDQLFMDHYITTKSLHPGRMAPNTAFCFLLFGITLSLVNFLPRLRLLTVLGALITGLGAIALFGYATGVNVTYGWGHLTQMAVHTSIAFTLLGVGIVIWGFELITKANESNHPILLSTIGVSLLALVIALWQVLNGFEDYRLKQAIEHQLIRLDDAFIAKLESQSLALNRMAFRWGNQEVLSKTRWQADAKNYYNDFKFFNSISKVDNLLNTNWVIPQDSKIQILNKTYIAEENYDDFLLQAKAQKLVIASNPIQLDGGDFGIVIFVPLLKNDNMEGFLQVVVDLGKMLKVIPKPNAFEDNYQLTLHSNNLIFARIGKVSNIDERFKVNSDINFEGLEWQTELVPTTQYIKSLRSSLPKAVLFSGLIVISLLLIMLVLRQRALSKTALLLSETNKREILESDLAQKEELLRVTLESMVDAVILIDPKGTIYNFNTAAETTFGYAKNDVLGQNIRMLMPEPYHSEHDGYLHNYNSGGEPKIIGSGREVIGLRCNGEQFPMTLAVAEVKTKQQHFFSGIIRDITRQKKADEAVSHYTQELLQSNKELDDFAYVASHDLKAPLRGIVQLANWIEEDLASSLDAQTKEYLILMHNRINRLNKLLDDLLAYSRVGREQGGLTETNFDDLTKDIFQLLNPPQGFELKLMTNVSSIVTLAVPFELLLRNLINNAIKHHDKEAGLITVKIEEKIGEYQVTVSDDGPGIPPEHQAKVFQIFQTLKPRDEVEGSGMGLAIVKKILDRYRCKINIKSDGVRGTDICFSWPCENTFRKYING